MLFYLCKGIYNEVEYVVTHTHTHTHIYIWYHWGLNSGPHECYADTLPLEVIHTCNPYYSGRNTKPCFVLGIFEIGSHKLYAQAGLKP
jgi:hypothetical protein